MRRPTPLYPGLVPDPLGQFSRQLVSDNLSLDWPLHLLVLPLRRSNVRRWYDNKCGLYVNHSSEFFHKAATMDVACDCTTCSCGVMHWHKKLTKCRKESGLSQEQVGAALGLSQQAYANYEAGKSFPPFLAAYKLSRILQFNLDWLMNDEMPITEGRAVYDLWLDIKELGIERAKRRMRGLPENPSPVSPGVQPAEYAQPVGPEIELPFRRTAASHKDAKRDDKRPEPEGTPKRRR
jgi:transcriptional regulator with XRE-family HTH domain